MSHKIEKLKNKILNALGNDGVMSPLVLHNRVMKTKYSVLEYSQALDELLENKLISFNGTFYHLEVVTVCR